MVKRCFKCGVEKPLAEFARHQQMADGHINKCKECVRKYALEHRRQNIDRIRAYDRQRSQLPHRRQRSTEGCANERRSHPIRNAVRQRTFRALRSGVIVKPNACERCGAGGRLDAHHNDYANPFAVSFLCRPCHAIADAERRAREEGAA